MSDCIKRQSKANDEALKQELRRFKNREAARRVRERKSNQLNTYKGQVDELKRENQKLLQIIQQLQEASLSGPCIRAISACDAGTHCLQPDMSLAPDSLETTPSAAAAAAVMAAAVAAGAASGPANLQGLVSHHSVSNHHQQALSSPWALTNGAAAGASPLEPCDSALASDPACVMSQPGLASAMYSTTLLPATFSAPLMGVQHSIGGPDSVVLQRACGCKDDEECDECEGVMVSLCNSSSLPVVTTPGPKPKRLTLDDLKIPVARFASDNNLLCPPSPLSAATEAKLLQQAKEEQQRQQALLLQGTFQQLDNMDMDLVETLEPSRPGQHLFSAPAAVEGARYEAHCGSGNVLLSGSTAPSSLAKISSSCYIRKTSHSGEPGAASAPSSGARVSFLDMADLADPELPVSKGMAVMLMENGTSDGEGSTVKVEEQDMCCDRSCALPNAAAPAAQQRQCWSGFPDEEAVASELQDMPDNAVFDSAIASIAESMASMDQEGIDAVMQLAMQEGVLLVD
eukprot:gene5672-5910_t